MTETPESYDDACAAKTERSEPSVGAITAAPSSWHARVFEHAPTSNAPPSDSSNAYWPNVELRYALYLEEKSARERVSRVGAAEGRVGLDDTSASLHDARLARDVRVDTALEGSSAAVCEVHGALRRARRAAHQIRALHHAAAAVTRGAHVRRVAIHVGREKQ